MRGGGGGDDARVFLFFFPCSADPDHERECSPCKVVFFGLETITLNVRNNNNNNNNNSLARIRGDMAKPPFRCVMLFVQEHVDRSKGTSQR